MSILTFIANNKALVYGGGAVAALLGYKLLTPSGDDGEDDAQYYPVPYSTGMSVPQNPVTQGQTPNNSYVQSLLDGLLLGVPNLPDDRDPRNRRKRRPRPPGGKPGLPRDEPPIGGGALPFAGPKKKFDPDWWKGVKDWKTNMPGIGKFVPGPGDDPSYLLKGGGMREGGSSGRGQGKRRKKPYMEDWSGKPPPRLRPRRKRKIVPVLNRRRNVAALYSRRGDR